MTWWVDRVWNWRFAARVGVIYLLLYFGGNVSFAYTHKCVRSHTEMVYSHSAEDLVPAFFCDFYAANDKRWTLLDPIRGLYAWAF